MSVFIIAEAGVNHNGDEARALAMVDAAAGAGADAVKFQTFSASKLVGTNAAKAPYQERETGPGDQFGMLAALELTEAMHVRLVERCATAGIEFMSTPFDLDAADFLLSLGMRRIKIPSGELVNHPFIDALARRDAPLILSTGMGTMEEIEEAIEVIRGARDSAGLDTHLDQALTVLHCTSNYPAALEDVNLRAMRTIADRTGLPVGYSDHTMGDVVAIGAVAAGAKVIEKHFTLDRLLPGPDHRASLEPDQLATLVTRVRDMDRALGSAVKAPTASEIEVRAVARRSVCAARALSAGTRIAEADLALLRPASGIEPRHFRKLPGRIMARAVPAGTPLQWSDLT